jgi:drug/metabolite transporter (DMT)-like permease
MLNYFTLSSLAAFIFAIGMLFNKFVAKHKVKERDSLMTYFMISLFLFSLVLFPFIDKSILSLTALQPVLVIVFSYLIGYYFFYTGIGQVDASVFAPLVQLQVGFVAIWAFLFLGERFPIQSYFWILFLLLGAILVSFNEKMNLKAFLTPGIFFILGSTFCHSISSLFAGYALRQLGPLQILFWEYFLVGILVLPFIAKTKPKLTYPLKDVWPLLVATFLGGIGTIFLLKAFKENLTISIAISMMTAPIVFLGTVIASRFKPKLLEYHPRRVYLVRAIGLVLILFAAFRLSVG